MKRLQAVSWKPILVMLLLFLLACGLASVAAAETPLAITVPDEVTVGQDISVTVSGLAEGEEALVSVLDQEGRILNYLQQLADDGAVQITFDGYGYVDRVTSAGTWRIQVTTGTAEAERTFRASGSVLEAPEVSLLSVDYSETEGTAVVQLDGSSGADQIQVMHAFFNASGRLENTRYEISDLSDGKASLISAESLTCGWSMFIRARVGGIWTEYAPVMYVPGKPAADVPTVTIQADAWTDPTELTVSAPGWEGNGYLVLITTDGRRLHYRWSLTFADGVAVAPVNEHYLGTGLAQAVLFRDDVPVAWSEPVQITFTDGANPGSQDYYPVSASVSGTRKAGDVLAVDMSTPDQAETFRVQVKNAAGNVIFERAGVAAHFSFPVWVFNEAGKYQIVCSVNGNYLSRTLSVTISENSQPEAPVIGEELEELNGLPYLRLTFPGEGVHDGYFCEITSISSDWSTPDYSAREYGGSILIRADVHGAGNFRIRICQVCNGVCSPWAYSTYRYGLPPGTEIVVEMPDTVTFGTDYTISTPTKLDGYGLWLRIVEKGTDNVVYDALDHVNTRIFEMDGSLLPEGEYTAILFTLQENLTGSKDFTVVGAGPAKPTLSADILLLTQPGSITFTVIAPGADAFYLSVAGVATPSYPVVDGEGVVTIPFSTYKKGTYEVRARAQLNGVNSVWSDPISITFDMTELGDDEWSEPVYTWSEDGSSLTATRHSLEDETIVETETVAAMRLVTKSPTETEAGTWRLQSDNFANKAFTAQQGATGTVPALKDMTVSYLPANLTTLNQEALAGISCQAIIVPAGCTNIEKRAFANNEDLLYLRVSDKVIIPLSAVEGCPNLAYDWYDYDAD